LERRRSIEKKRPALSDRKWSRGHRGTAKIVTSARRKKRRRSAGGRNNWRQNGRRDRARLLDPLAQGRRKINLLRRGESFQITPRRCKRRAQVTSEAGAVGGGERRRELEEFPPND